MNIKNYNEIKVVLYRATEDPLRMMDIASGITMKRDFKRARSRDTIEKTVKGLLDMGHTSLFEHINYTFLIEGASRSFLAQITRHRVGSFTSGSQHYQDYSEYGFKVYEPLQKDKRVKKCLETCIDTYKDLIKAGYPKEEARQVLPNGMENNLLWTVNARSLINFLNLRLCKRNVSEMRTVAVKVHKLAINHFPALFNQVGPDCYMKKKCSQGKMACKMPPDCFPVDRKTYFNLDGPQRA